MRRVERDEIIDYVSYQEKRDPIRTRVMALKKVRRVHVGEYLTFLFENHDTVLYQVQEMMRVECIVREIDIEHEMMTYNELLGGEGELGCTLLVEIDDAEIRAELLSRWQDLPDHVYVETADGRKLGPVIDERQRDDRRLSTVQYLKFALGRSAPVAVGVDYPAGGITARSELTAEQAQALLTDLEGS
jgi:hypothetical protein